MLGSLFQHNDIDGVVVGADRIVANGDTANKVSYAASNIRPAHARSARTKPPSSLNATTSHS